MRFIQISATRQPALTDVVNYEAVCAEIFYGMCTTIFEAKDGNFIDFIALGRVDPLSVFASFSGEQFDAFWFEWLESLNVQLTLRQSERDRACEASGESELATLGRLHLVLDFDGLGAKHVKTVKPAMSFYIAHIARGAWGYYPECIGSFYCASANALWSLGYALMSAFGPPKTVAKVNKCGAVGSAQFKAAMALILDDAPATLPEVMGGRRSNRGSVTLPRRVDAACASTACSSSWTTTLLVKAGECVVVDIPMIDTEHPVWRSFRSGRAGSKKNEEPRVEDDPLVSEDVQSRSVWATQDGVPVLRVPPADVALTSRAIVLGAAGTTGGGALHYKWSAHSDNSADALAIDFSSAFQPSVEGAGEAGVKRVACRVPAR